MSSLLPAYFIPERLLSATDRTKPTVAPGYSSKSLTMELWLLQTGFIKTVSRISDKEINHYHWHPSYDPTLILILLLGLVKFSSHVKFPNWNARENCEFVPIRKMALSQSQLFCQNFLKLSCDISEEQMLWIAIIVRFSAIENLQLLQVNSQSDEIMVNIKQSVILTEQKLSTDLLASQVVAW